MSEANKAGFKVLRIVAALFALGFSAVASLFLQGGLSSGYDLIGIGLIFVFAIPAVLCWWFAFRGHFAKDRTVMTCAVIGALIIGGVSFAIGFIGPMIFMPGANQGPLLGIFITGPLGFVAGAVIGLCIGVVRVFFLKPRGII